MSMEYSANWKPCRKAGHTKRYPSGSCAACHVDRVRRQRATAKLRKDGKLAVEFAKKWRGMGVFMAVPVEEPS